MFRTHSMLLLLTALFLACPLQSMAQEPTAAAPRVVMETSLGTIKIELFDKEAPLSAENFRAYVRKGFYDGLLFHRVIPGFMIQGGGMEPGMKERQPTRPNLPNEATNGLKNLRGTLSMARKPDIHSASSQFFLNVNDNPSLDHRGKEPQLFGYAVFGKVVEGMDVADKIVAVPTTRKGMYSDVPVKDVLIIKVYEEKSK
jgi:cyclophilin family peptidyl-prolyl cis-trans isomerase